MVGVGLAGIVGLARGAWDPLLASGEQASRLRQSARKSVDNAIWRNVCCLSMLGSSSFLLVRAKQSSRKERSADRDQRDSNQQPGRTQVTVRDKREWITTRLRETRQGRDLGRNQLSVW